VDHGAPGQSARDAFVVYFAVGEFGNFQFDDDGLGDA